MCTGDCTLDTRAAQISRLVKSETTPVTALAELAARHRRRSETSRSCLVGRPLHDAPLLELGGADGVLSDAPPEERDVGLPVSAWHPLLARTLGSCGVSVLARFGSGEFERLGGACRLSGPGLLTGVGERTRLSAMACAS